MNFEWCTKIAQWWNDARPNIKKKAIEEVMRLAATSILWLSLGAMYVIAYWLHLINDKTTVPEWINSPIKEIFNISFLGLETIVLLTVLFFLVKNKYFPFASIVREEISRAFYMVGIFVFVFSLADDFAHWRGFRDWFLPTEILCMTIVLGFALLILFETAKSDSNSSA